MVLYKNANTNAKKKHTCFKTCTVERPLRSLNETFLVGGFNPFEKYARQIGFIFPNFRGENKKYLKPPPRFDDHTTKPRIPRCHASKRRNMETFSLASGICGFLVSDSGYPLMTHYGCALYFKVRFRKNH